MRECGKKDENEGEEYGKDGIGKGWEFWMVIWLSELVCEDVGKGFMYRFWN